MTKARSPTSSNSNELPLFAQSSVVPGLNKARPWTISELNARIRGTLEPAFMDIWVQGEVSNLRPAASGHLYFSLKDEGAVVSAAIFGWGARQKKPGSFDLKDGLKVLARGKISVYAPRGNYQLLIEQIEPIGAGALQLAFEQLKAKLQREGLFDPARKKPLPKFPHRIAVVTSPSGAAIRDMLNVLSRRAPQIEITIIPAVVQGEAAPEQIRRGLELANRWNLGEVVVLARGGGSIEDLWCFNDEALARAIAASRLPTISAVGHEIDFTISDFVSDLRAPTPSAAAEIVSGHWADITRQVSESQSRLGRLAIREISTRMQTLRHLRARLINPRDRLREQAQRTDEAVARLERALMNQLERRRAGVDRLMGKLDALSPLRVLERGYSLVREAGDGPVLRSANQGKIGQEIEIRFYDGKRKAKLTDG